MQSTAQCHQVASLAHIRVPVANYFPFVSRQDRSACQRHETRISLILAAVVAQRPAAGRPHGCSCDCSGSPRGCTSGRSRTCLRPAPRCRGAGGRRLWIGRAAEGPGDATVGAATFPRSVLQWLARAPAAPVALTLTAQCQGTKSQGPGGAIRRAQIRALTCPCAHVRCTRLLYACPCG
jgi:hypothetical protein